MVFVIWLLSAIAVQYSRALLSNYPVSSKETLFVTRISENGTFTKLPNNLLAILNKTTETNCDISVNWLYPTNEKDHVPFVIINKNLVLSKGSILNCESKRVYDLHIKANCIDPQKNVAARLRLFIDDVNEYKPFFSQDVYETSYVEGEGLNYILKVIAYDHDCVNDHHACDYKIITENMPFQINSNGLIWPTIPLDSKVNTQFEFKIVAIDCTDKSISDPATIKVYVKDACKSRFKVDRSSEFNMHYPFRNLRLDVCSFCKPIDIIARVGLEFDEPEKISCDDIKCDYTNRTIVNLLHTYDKFETTQPSSLLTYSFNGYDDFLDVESNQSFQNAKDQGTQIRFWMRLTIDLEPKLKRQILCESDVSESNRHYFSIYIQSGHLHVLKQHNSVPHRGNHEFFPSQWSWNISHLQDGNWHFFDILIEYPSHELRVDLNPNKIKLDKSINEWPIPDIYIQEQLSKTHLTIGACWHGKSEKYAHNFFGDLSSLQIMISRVTRNSCHRNCSQRLEMDKKEELNGSFALNKNKSVIVLRSSNLVTLQNLLKWLRYISSNDPIPLSVSLNGTIICENMPKMKISDLWLRTSNRKTQNSSQLTTFKNEKHDPKRTNEESIMKTTPGFLYSGWMIAILVTMASGVAIGTLTILMTNRPPTHHRCPTEETEWDTLNPNVTNNPLRKQENINDVMLWSL